MNTSLLHIAESWPAVGHRTRRSTVTMVYRMDKQNIDVDILYQISRRVSHYSYLFHNWAASYYEHKSSHPGISPFHGCNHLAHMAFHNDGRDLMLTTLKVCRAVVYMIQVIMSIIKDSSYHAVFTCSRIRVFCSSRRVVCNINHVYSINLVILLNN